MEGKAALEALLKDEAKLTEIATNVMKSLDKDGSGKLEFAEIKAMVTGFMKDANVPADKMPTDEAIQAEFKKMDSDGSGSVEAKELVPMVKAILTEMLQ